MRSLLPPPPVSDDADVVAATKRGVVTGGFDDSDNESEATTIRSQHVRGASASVFGDESSIDRHYDNNSEHDHSKSTMTLNMSHSYGSVNASHSGDHNNRARTSTPSSTVLDPTPKRRAAKHNPSTSTPMMMIPKRLIPGIAVLDKHPRYRQEQDAIEKHPDPSPHLSQGDRVARRKSKPTSSTFADKVVMSLKSSSSSTKK